MPLLCHLKSNRTTVGRLGGVQDQILLPRALAHKSVLLGTPDGMVEWGRKAIEVRETMDAAQIIFEDRMIETCDLRPGLINHYRCGRVQECMQTGSSSEEVYRLQYKCVFT